MIITRSKVFAIFTLAFAVVAGCGQENYERKNDAGPPVQMNEEGPGPMMPPGEEGESALPQNMKNG